MSSPFLFPFLISFSLFKLILNGKHTKLKHNITLVGFGDILRSFYFLSIKAHFPEHQNLKFQCSMILVLILVLKFGMLDFHLVLNNHYGSKLKERRIDKQIRKYNLLSVLQLFCHIYITFRFKHYTCVFFFWYCFNFKNTCMYKF